MQVPSCSSPISGTDIAAKVLQLKGQDREDYFLELVKNGNVPDFYRQAVPLTLSTGAQEAVLEVACDHLIVGVDDDYIHAQVNIITAQKMADVLGAMLPTPKIVDLIWRAAPMKLPPMAWGPPYSKAMFSSQRLVEQSRRICAQRRGDLASLAGLRGMSQKTAKAFMPKQVLGLGTLTAGNFKDYVLVDELAKYSDRTCIYGWHQLTGEPIQPVQFKFHEKTYIDYSQCPRFCSLDVALSDGSKLPVAGIMDDNALWGLVSNRGRCKVARVPGV